MNRVYTAEKAGMKDVDKNHILDVIASSSTPAYQAFNENKKAEYDKKLNRMKEDLKTLNQEEQLVCNSEADEFLFQCENSRNLDNSFVHIDMDSFFASVEMRDDPKLRFVPMAVGTEQMISTSNYIARKFGVRSAMPGYIAKKLCPTLVFVNVNYEKYTEVAKISREIFAQYDPNFHSGGLDEASLNLTEYCQKRETTSTFTGFAYDGNCQCNMLIWKFDESYSNVTREKLICKKCEKEQIFYTYERQFGCLFEDVVNEIRFRVEQATGGLTCSAGISVNSFLSKICSEHNKPNGQFSLDRTRDEIVKFVENLDVRSIPGIGPSTEYTLNGLGMKTCKDVITNRALIWYLFTDKQRKSLLRKCYGVSEMEMPDEGKNGETRHTLSRSRTFIPTNNRAYLEDRLKSMTEYVFQTMADDGYFGCLNVGIKVKYTSFQEVSRTKSVLSPLSNWNIAFEIVKNLLDQLLKDNNTSIRMIGVVLSDLVSDAGKISSTLDNFLGPKEANKETVDSGEIIFERRVKVKKTDSKSSKNPKVNKLVNGQMSLNAAFLNSKRPIKRPLKSDENNAIETVTLDDNED